MKRKFCKKWTGFGLSVSLLFHAMPSNYIYAESVPNSDITEAKMISPVVDQVIEDEEDKPEIHYFVENGEPSKSGYQDMIWVDENGQEVEGEYNYQDDSHRTFSFKSSNTDIIDTLPDIRNQGQYGTCWAHAAVSSLESNMIMQQQADKNVNYSERHLAYFAHTKDSITGDGVDKTDSTYGKYGGGNATEAISTWANWYGAANESDYPYYSYTSDGTMDNLTDKDRTSSVCHLTDAYLLTTSDDIKMAIQNIGAVMCSFCSGNGTQGTDVYVYNSKERTTDHGVSIVGWDDTISKENFHDSETKESPSQNGAWLCRNSWGTDWGLEDHKGYFWISYEDKSITRYYSFIGTVSDNYDKIYSYSGAGYGGSIGCSQSANIFTTDSIEELKAVSFYSGSNYGYQIDIYVQQGDTMSSPADGLLAYSQTGDLPYAGYHTIPLEESVILNEKEKYAVAITFFSKDGKDPQSFFEYGSEYSSNAGESFYSMGSNWIDTYGKKGSNGEEYHNFPIMAFTDSITDNSAIFAKLSELIAQAEKLTASDYTSSSWANLQAALNTAKKISNTATNSELNQAVRNLQSAIANLLSAYIDISNLDDWKKFEELVSTNKIDAEQTVRLQNDLDMTDISKYTCIGSSTYPFIGTFDGQEHTISNISGTYDNFYTGLFSSIGKTGSVKNLTLDHVNFTSNAPYCGGIAGENAGTISNCHVNGTITFNNSGWDGGITGENTGTVEDSSIDCTILCQDQADQYNIGGIVGDNQGKILRCYTIGKIISDSAASIGGIVGWSDPDTVIEQCYNLANISGTPESAVRTAGIGAVLAGNVKECYNYGNISRTSSGRYGAIYGGKTTSGGTGTFSNCYYLDTSVNTEYGTNATSSSDAKSLTANQFNSAEAAYFLNTNNGSIANTYTWSQNNERHVPVLANNDNKAVIKVTVSQADTNTYFAFISGVKEGYFYANGGSNVKLTFDDSDEYKDYSFDAVKISGLTAVSGSNDTYTLPEEDVSVIVTCKPQNLKKLSIELSIANWTYGDTESVPSVNIQEEDYDGGDPTYEYKVRGTADSTYNNDIPTNAGDYTIRVTCPDTDKYDTATATADFTIERKTIGITWDNTMFTYNGTEQVPSATATGLVNGDSCTITITGAETNAGTYIATATNLDNNNYVLPSSGLTKEFTIMPKTLTTDMVLLEQKEYSSTGNAISPKPTVKDRDTILTENTDYTLDGDVTQSVYGTYKITVKGKGNYTGSIDVMWKILDSTQPTGSIQISNNTWTEFLNAITFGYFFKETQTVTITGEDSESGIDKIYYYISNTEMDKAGLDGLSDENWKLLENGGSFSIAPEQKAIVYAKLTDKSGNSTYINSNGLVFDATTPMIRIGENVLTNNTENTYCTQQTINISDENIESVKIGDKTYSDTNLSTDGNYTLKADGTKYLIIATDKAGNTTTVTIKVNESHSFTKYTTIKEATCKEEGEQTAKCDYCNETNSKTIEKISHSSSEPIVENEIPATCTRKGSYDQVVYCAVCKEEINRTTITTEALGHEFEETYTVDIPATCTTAGSQSQHCKRCEEIQNVQEIAATGHSFGEWTQILSPSCTDKGSKQRVCSKCDYAETEDVDETGHDWKNDYTIDREATCTEDGSKSIHCSKCDVVKDSEVIPATGHTNSEAVIENEISATCTSRGSYDQVVYCAVCKEEVSRSAITTEALGHEFEETYTVDIPATCTTVGSQSQHCRRCEETQNVQEIAATGHSFGEWTQILSPSCTDKGSRQRVCSKCDYAETEDVDETGHDWKNDYTIDKEPTCSEDGSKSIHCSKCDVVKDSEVIPATGHTNSEAVVENEIPAACTRKGSYNQVVYCAICKEEVSRSAITTEALGHDYTSKVTKPATTVETGVRTYTCTRCGDTYTKAIPKLEGVQQPPINYPTTNIGSTTGTNPSNTVSNNTNSSNINNTENQNKEDTSGNTTNTQQPSKPDETITDSNTIVKPDGTIVTTETETKTDGSVTTVKEVTAGDKSATIIVSETSANGTTNINSVIRTGISNEAGIVDITANLIQEAAEDKRIGSIVVEITDATINSTITKDKKAVVNVNIPSMENVEIEKVVLTKDSIEAAKGTGKELKVNVNIVNVQTETENAYTVTIPAKQLAKIDSAVNEINITITAEAVANITDSSKKNNITRVVNQNKGKQKKTCIISLASNKNINAGMKVTVPVTDKTGITKNNKVYTYKYDKKTGKLYEMANCKQTVSVNGAITIAAASGTDYVVSSKKLSGNKVETIKDNIDITISKKTAKAGKVLEINISLPDTVSTKKKFGTEKATITYKSSNSKVASVSKKGIVTTKKKGTVTLTTMVKLSSGQKITKKQEIKVK